MLPGALRDATAGERRAAHGRREQHLGSWALLPASDKRRNDATCLLVFFLSLLLLSRSEAEICSQDGETGGGTVL